MHLPHYFSYSLLILMAFFLLVLLILLKLIPILTSPKSNLPPGPCRLPIIGNILNLACPLPHRRLRDLSNTYGPIMHLKLGELSTIVVSSPESAKEVLKTNDLHFASRPLNLAAYIISYKCKSLFFAPYGEYWRQLRKLCILELLSVKRIRSFRYIKEEEVDNLISSISSCSDVLNLTKMSNVMVNNVVTRAAIGDKCKYQDMFLAAFYEAVELSSGFNLSDLYPSLSWVLDLLTGSKRRLERCHRKLDWILSDIVQEHEFVEINDCFEEEKKINEAGEEQVEDDLVDSLLRLQAGGDLPFELTTESIKALVMDMFVAGGETSSSVLIWAMSELMKNPQAMKRAQDEVREKFKGQTKVTEQDVSELNYLQLVIKETMRLHPPLPLLLPRESRTACRLLGYEIPRKSRVLVNVWAIGRDPSYWEDAEDFKPDRFEGSTVDYKGESFEFLPFGAGRRMCPGMLFGMANVEFPLARLLYHFDWELPEGIRPEDLDMAESLGITAHKKSDLCLRAIPLKFYDNKYV